MKRLLLLSLFLVFANFSFGETFESTARIEFKSGSVKVLNIFNKSGRVDVVRRLGNRGVFVDVAIVCNARTEMEAKNVFDKIGIKQTNANGNASVFTEISDIKKVKNLLSGIDYSVNYSVAVPWGIDLSIVNEKGTVIVPDYDNKVKIQSKNCNVYVGNVKGEGLCQISMTGGTLEMKGAENVKMNLSGCSFQIGDVFNLEFKARDSKGAVNSVTLLRGSMADVDMDIQTAEDISGTFDDCRIVLGDLGDCLSLDLARGSFDVKKVHYSFDKILVNSIWGRISLNFMPEAGYNLNLQHDKRLKLTLPSGSKLAPMNSPSKNLRVGTGHFGNASRKGEVNLKMTGGMLNIL